MNLSVSRSWFDPKLSTSNFEFNDQITVDLELLTTSLEIKFTDQFGGSFHAFRLTRVALEDDHRRLVFWFDIQKSVYNATIVLKQTNKKTIVYNDYSFFPATEEFEVKAAYKIRDKKQQLLEEHRTALQLVLWILMVVCLLLGGLSDKKHALTLMKVMAFFNMFSHMNGPLMHGSK